MSFEATLAAHELFGTEFAGAEEWWRLLWLLKASLELSAWPQAVEGRSSVSLLARLALVRRSRPSVSAGPSTLS